MKNILSVFVLMLVLVPGISFAKGAPLFFQTGDELFEIKGAPAFDEGYSVGYACQRFGLFGADIWTWDCKLMAVNIEDFSAGELGDELKAQMESTYSLSDRVRNPWNHYGVFVLLIALVGYFVVRRGSNKVAS